MMKTVRTRCTFGEMVETIQSIHAVRLQLFYIDISLGLALDEKSAHHVETLHVMLAISARSAGESFTLSLICVTIRMATT